MNTYICYFNGKKVEIKADTTYKAYVEARVFFNTRRSNEHMISVCLAEKDGEAVEVSPAAV